MPDQAGARERVETKALRSLETRGALLLPIGEGDRFGVFPREDRRVRALARLSADEVIRLASEGAIARVGDRHAYALTDAGRRRIMRADARTDEAFGAQHAPIVERYVAEGAGAVRRVRGYQAEPVLARLAGMRDGRGAALLTPAELRAAHALRTDWERGQARAARGADWSAAPSDRDRRGSCNGLEIAFATGCDARARFTRALEGLGAPLRRVVEDICLRERGLEAIEAGSGWPARSAKVALKLALAQLAQNYGREHGKV